MFVVYSFQLHNLELGEENIIVWAQFTPYTTRSEE